MHEGRDGAEYSYGCAGSYGYLGIRIDDGSVVGPDQGGQGLPQCRNARHWRILIMAGLEMPGNRRKQFGRRLKVRVTLREIDGAMLFGKPRHYCEYSRADVRKFASNLNHVFAGCLRLDERPISSCVAALLEPAFNRADIAAVLYSADAA